MSESTHRPAGSSLAIVLSITFLAFCVFFSSVSLANDVIETSAEKTPVPIQKPRELPQRSALGMNLPPLVELPSAEANALDQMIALEERRRRGETPLQIGFERSFTSKTISFTLADAHGGGTARAAEYLAVEGSEAVWSARLQVDKAFAFRIYLQDVELSRFARLWIYGQDGQVLGPFNSKMIDANGGMWLPPLEGSEIFIEVRVPENDLERGARIHFTIQKVSELILDLEGAVKGEGFGSEPQTWQNCAIDISCEEGAPFIIDDFARGISRLVYTDDGGGTFLCSGGMVNDTVEGSFIPYLLTANHCFDSSSEAASLTSYFDYRSSVCGGSPPSLGSVPQVSGADLLASDPASDFTLVRLSSNPGGRLFFGWTTASPADSETLYGLHHPAGQKAHYSTTTFNQTGAIECPSLPRPSFHYSTGLTGSTAGGSSGSPIIDPTGKIYGQLFGACGFTLDDDCDYADFRRVDGAFATTYPLVEEWLNPQTCQDDQYEDDDVCFGTLIEPGSSQDHSHCDVDWVWFGPTPGHTYRIETSNLGGGSDTVLSLHESCGAALVTDDDSGAEPFSSRIDWQAADATVIDIQIMQFGDSYADGKTYTITVTDITPLYLLEVTKSGVGFGSVTSDLPGINCDPNCSAEYFENDFVTLTATPDLGSRFVEWTGDCSGTDPSYAITINAAKTCNAVFELDDVYYDLIVTKSGAGNCTVTSFPAGIDCGADCEESFIEQTAVELLATPANGSYFVEWTPAECGGPDASTVVTMNNSKTCNVRCELEVYWNLFVTTAGTGSGTVSSDPGGIDCGADCSEDYLEGTDVELTASPNPGSYFVGWTGGYCDAGPNPIVVPMDASRTCTAQFDLLPGDLQIVYGVPGTLGAQAGGPARFDIMYDVSNADASLTGIGIRVHYDSSKLTFDQVTETLAFGPLFDPELVAPEPDNADFDGDPNTDSFILLAWVDFGGNWPGTLPEKLAAVHFTTAPGFTGDTPINFTASDLAAGYALDASVVTIFEQPCNLDLDDNGSYGALTDGVLTVRHLFGFTGQQLVDGALAPDANRTDPAEIIAYLDGCLDMLDPDGNGVYGALTDGVLIVRYLFGFTGQQLVDGALAPDATRTDPAAIIAYLDNYTPALGPLSQPASSENAAPRGQQAIASRVGRDSARGSDKQYDVTVDYTTSVASLTGLGLRMHFDSSKLSLLELRDMFSTGMLQYQVQDDILDFDDDKATDRFILVSWMDPWGDWPGTYETELFTARFQAVKSQGSAKTTVRYSVAGAAAGMEAQFMPVEVGPGSNAKNAQ